MQAVERMLSNSPNRSVIESKTLVECIDACGACVLACASCADACDGERDHLQELRRCVRLNLDCAAICFATASVLSRQLLPDENVFRVQAEACEVVCATCAAECERYAEMHEHCRVCAEACRRCEVQCRRVVRQFTSA
jgi:hypothetical protein